MRSTEAKLGQLIFLQTASLTDQHLLSGTLHITGNWICLLNNRALFLLFSVTATQGPSKLLI